MFYRRYRGISEAVCKTGTYAEIPPFLKFLHTNIAPARQTFGLQCIITTRGIVAIPSPPVPRAWTQSMQIRVHGSVSGSQYLAQQRASPWRCLQAGSTSEPLVGRNGKILSNMFVFFRVRACVLVWLCGFCCNMHYKKNGWMWTKLADTIAWPLGIGTRNVALFKIMFA